MSVGAGVRNIFLGTWQYEFVGTSVDLRTVPHCCVRGGPVGVNIVLHIRYSVMVQVCECRCFYAHHSHCNGVVQI